MTLMDKGPSLSCQDSSLGFLLSLCSGLLCLVTGLVDKYGMRCWYSWLKALVYPQGPGLPCCWGCMCSCACWPFSDWSQGCHLTRQHCLSASALAGHKEELPFWQRAVVPKGEWESWPEVHLHYHLLVPLPLSLISTRAGGWKHPVLGAGSKWREKRLVYLKRSPSELVTEGRLGNWSTGGGYLCGEATECVEKQTQSCIF